MKSILYNFLFLLCILCCIVISIITSCKKETDEALLKINGPVPSPVLPSTPYNYVGNDNVATLGRVIFYDKNLSLSNTISCGSCHKQQFAFSDNKQFSRGLYNGFTSRNSSAILNSQGHNKFWDGRAGNFDTAVFMPVMNHLEMDIFNLNLLPQKFSNLPYYPDLFFKAFGTKEINISFIREALATFAENLDSYSNKNDQNSLNVFEMQGKGIFNGKARCYSCHNGSDFNGYQTSYENIGLDINYSDNGRGNITKNTGDYGKFAVPTLRNIALTAPYMHDGRYKTLREVIDHYDKGVQNHQNLSWALKDFTEEDIPGLEIQLDTVTTQESLNIIFAGFPAVKLNLSEEEKKVLEAYLNALTDVVFITEPKLSNPF